MIYKAEYDDCTSIRARFNQYFIFGETLDCNQWKTDYLNCYEWEKHKSEKAYVCADYSIILTIILIKIMLWKIAGWVDHEREATQERAFTHALSERCLGEEGKTTGELERSSTWVDAEGIRELVFAYKKSRDKTGQGKFSAWFEVHYIVTINGGFDLIFKIKYGMYICVYIYIFII